HEEGVVIAPTHLLRAGEWDYRVLQQLAGVSESALQADAAALAGPEAGDFSAQVSANRVGVIRLQDLIAHSGVAHYQSCVAALNADGCRLAMASLKRIPAGEYSFADYLDDDGAGTRRIPISARIVVSAEGVLVDFAGTADQVPGNVNCPLSVAAA